MGQFAFESCEAEIKSTEENDVPETYRRLVQRLGAVLNAVNGVAPQKGIVSLAQKRPKKRPSKNSKNLLKHWSKPSKIRKTRAKT